MIDNIENKIEILNCRNALKKIGPFARNIYETETITLGLSYIEDLIFLENNIV